MSRFLLSTSLLGLVLFGATACGDDAALDACVEGDPRLSTCGLNGRGTRTRACQSNGLLETIGTCEDPDECVDGDTRLVGCAEGDFGGSAQACVVGAWSVDACAPLSLAVGGVHTCTARASGKVACWGRSSEGQMGDGRAASGAFENSPVAVWSPIMDEVRDVRAVSSGYSHSCAMRTVADGDTRVLCWGLNSSGQIGSGSEERLAIDPAYVRGLNHVISLSAGDFHTCVVRSEGDVRCWGSNLFGRLGRPVEEVELMREPVRVEGIDDAVAVSAGLQHSCVLRAGGGVACWGLSDDGRLGDGSPGTTERDVVVPTPVQVQGLEDAVAVSAGGNRTCALRATGEVVCWGANTTPEGRLSRAPVAVPGIVDAKAVAVGDLFQCVLRQDGTVWCWGRQRKGELGDGIGESFVTSPVPVAGLDEVIDLSVGTEHACALRATGELRCWGRGDFGQLGNGAEQNATTPVTVVPETFSNQYDGGIPPFTG